MADFAVAYADQVERDYATLKAAVKNGKVKPIRSNKRPAARWVLEVEQVAEERRGRRSERTRAMGKAAGLLPRPRK
jgi:hypothetical protein